jgi:prepilin-type N-terminal cleavage/methylation domain-containing protein
MKKRYFYKGFTLVELIVVVAVLALLAVGAVIAIRGVQRNARISGYRSDAVRLTDALNIYNGFAVGAEITNTNEINTVSTASGSVSLVLSVETVESSDMNVDMFFSSPDRFELIKSFIEFHGSGSGGIWRVNEAAIVAAS